MEQTHQDRGTVLIELLLKSHRVAKTLALSAHIPLDELYCLTLIHSEKPCCVKVLSRLLGVRGPRTSKLLGSAERKGYLKRTMNAVDHRMEEIRLTNEGMEAVKRLIEESGELLDSLFDAGEIDQIWRLIGCLEHARPRGLRPSRDPASLVDQASRGLVLPDEE